MQRYNSFTLIHKGLRAMLYDTALSLQQTNFAETDEAETVLEKVESVLHLFEQHAHHEDNFVLRAVEAYVPELVTAFEKEHVTDILLGNRLKNLLNIYHNVNFTDERMAAGSAISKAFVEFMVFNLEHMAKEELLLNQALWKYYTDDQLIELNQKLVASLPEEEKMLNSLWMLRGINNADAIAWLKSIKQSAPVFMFNQLLNIAEKELPAKRFEKVMEGLISDAMVA